MNDIFMIKKRSKAVIFLICLLLFLAACKDGGDKNVTKASEGLYKTISMSVSLPPETKKQRKEAENNNTSEEKAYKVQNRQLVSLADYRSDFYDTKGKFDPFISLVQEKKTPASPGQKPPARVLSPLEKIDLDQLRLTAIVIMKNKRVAIVEEPSGKGYEIASGTYIGKNQGRVVGINERSIQVTERIKDYNGNIKEQLIEKKLYQYEYEE